MRTEDRPETAPATAVVAVSDARESLDLSSGRQVRVTPAATVFVGGLIAVAVAFGYHRSIAGGSNQFVPLAFGWRPTPVDWLTMVAGVVFVASVAVPVVRRPGVLRDYWAAYPDDWLSRVSLVVTAGVLAAGLLAPALLDAPRATLQATVQPPIGASAAESITGSCVGRVTDGLCHGTLAHPLGTAAGGEDILAWLAYGAWTVVRFLVLSVALLVPIGVGVGVTAAYAGGVVDRLLMGYVDVQTTIPTILLYLLVTFFTEVTLFWLIVVYGLFNWGSLARLVRTAARRELTTDYVEAAEAAGASRLHVVRRHVLPNVVDSVLVAVTLLLPKLILIEVGLAFLGFGGEDTFSWGQLLARGLLEQSTYAVGAAWWIVLLPAAAAVVFVGAASVVGDGFRTALD